jgi:D-sedoheptulose 7-phosphate isomerase
MESYIESYIQDSIKTKELILNNKDIVDSIKLIASKVTETYRSGKKVLLAGNGGSAADSQHIAGEFVCKFYKERTPLSAFALTVDTSVITSISNDFGYEQVFARQIKANGQKGDIFIALSTSGASPNILAAIVEANAQGLVTVGLTGAKQSQMNEICDVCINVPSEDTPKVQESHIMIGHIICALVEKNLFD